jgi:hypothetical protein
VFCAGLGSPAWLTAGGDPLGVGLACPSEVSVVLALGLWAKAPELRAIAQRRAIRAPLPRLPSPPSLVPIGDLPAPVFDFCLSIPRGFDPRTEDGRGQLPPQSGSARPRRLDSSLSLGGRCGSQRPPTRLGRRSTALGPAVVAREVSASSGEHLRHAGGLRRPASTNFCKPQVVWAVAVPIPRKESSSRRGRRDQPARRGCSPELSPLGFFQSEPLLEWH